MRHFAKLVYMLVILSLLGAACSGGSKSGGTTTNNDPAPISTPQLPVNKDNVPLVAIVNGVEITLPQFEKALARRQLLTGAPDPSTLMVLTMNNLIEQVLINQAAMNLDVSVSDAQLDTELQSYVTEAGGADQYQTWLLQNGYTQDEFRAAVRENLISSQVQAAVVDDFTGMRRHVHARHILVKTEAEAHDVLARLQAGEDFATLAAQLSQDITTASQGGDLGWFIEQELLEPSLAQVAFSLSPGQIAGPVATRLGYHIIQTLEFADREIIPEKAANLTQIQFENWLQSLVESAAIERYLI